MGVLRRGGYISPGQGMSLEGYSVCHDDLEGPCQQQPVGIRSPAVGANLTMYTMFSRNIFRHSCIETPDILLPSSLFITIHKSRFINLDCLHSKNLYSCIFCVPPTLSMDPEQSPIILASTTFTLNKPNDYGLATIWTSVWIPPFFSTILAQSNSLL